MHNVYVYDWNSRNEQIGLVPAPKEVSDIAYVAGTAGREVEILHGPGENAGADSPKPPKKRAGGGFTRLDVDGLPLVNPPYRTTTAINLDKADFPCQLPPPA